VVLAYIQNSQTTFNLAADDVVYLRDVARALSEYDRPFYGFQSAGLDGQTNPLDSVAQLAAAINSTFGMKYGTTINPSPAPSGTIRPAFFPYKNIPAPIAPNTSETQR